MVSFTINKVYHIAGRHAIKTYEKYRKQIIDFQSDKTLT